MPQALSHPSSRFNYILNEGDVITIPRVRDFVTLTGSVNNELHPQLSVPYFKGKRARFYITKYGGGFNKNTKRKLTMVTYPSGISKKTKNFLFFKVYPKVKKGSVIKQVPKPEKRKKDPRQRGNFWDGYAKAIAGITALTPIMTLLILIYR